VRFGLGLTSVINLDTVSVSKFGVILYNALLQAVGVCVIVCRCWEKGNNPF
jgi:hypothetical protein